MQDRRRMFNAAHLTWVRARSCFVVSWSRMVEYVILNSHVLAKELVSYLRFEYGERKRRRGSWMVGWDL